MRRSSGFTTSSRLTTRSGARAVFATAATAVALGAGVLGAGGLGPGGLGAGALAAPASSSASSGVFTLNPAFSPLQTPTAIYDESRFADGAAFQVQHATTSSIAITIPTGPSGTDDGTSIEIDAPAGGTIHSGLYTGIDNTSADFSKLGLTFTFGSQGVYFQGNLDVLDLATNASGTITRFDAVFLAFPGNAAGSWFGEIRFGEPEPAVHVGQQHIEFPETPVAGTAVLATERLHNTASTPVSVGAVAVTGGARTDYAVSHDACSNTVLAAGATCQFLVGFAAQAGGPRNATVTVPLGTSSQTIALTGSGSIGRTIFSTSGNDYVDGGASNRYPSGPWVVAVAPREDGWVWYATKTYGNVDPNTDTVMAAFDAWKGGRITPGTYATENFYGSADPYTDQGLPGTDFSGFGRGCSWHGNETVNSFALGADGLPIRADIVYSATCDNGDGQPLTGHLQWHVRSDITAPTALTGLSVTGTGAARTIHWTQSPSSDTTEDIVRVVQGDGTGATPTSGLAAKYGFTTSSAMPALVAGAPYTVAAFAVDGTGNVSTPATFHFTG